MAREGLLRFFPLSNLDLTVRDEKGIGRDGMKKIKIKILVIASLQDDKLTLAWRSSLVIGKYNLAFYTT